jgi:hypothetical protein
VQKRLPARKDQTVKEFFGFIYYLMDLLKGKLTRFWETSIAMSAIAEAVAGDLELKKS